MTRRYESVYSEYGMKHFLKLRKKAIAYFEKHVEFNAFTHMLGGIGLGILIASLVYPHPLRWALFFVGLSLLGHLYAVTRKK